MVIGATGMLGGEVAACLTAHGADPVGTGSADLDLTHPVAVAAAWPTAAPLSSSTAPCPAAASYAASTSPTSRPARPRTSPVSAARCVTWLPGTKPLLSPKDAAAPTVAAAEAQGLLPAYEDCVRYVSSLATPLSEETP